MKPCVRLPCYHWSQTYIFPSLHSSPLISPLSLFGAHTVWRRMMNTRLSKAHLLGVPFFEARSPLTHTHAVQTHTHTCNHYATDASQDKWTKVLRPTVLPTSRLKKSCITTSNSKTEIGCLCVLSHLLCFFFRGTTHLCYHLPFSAAVLCYNQANFTCLMIKGALCSFFCRRRNTNS